MRLLGLVAFAVLALIAWWLFRQLPHDEFPLDGQRQRLPNDDWAGW